MCLSFTFHHRVVPDFLVFDRPAAVRQKVSHRSRRRAQQMEEIEGRLDGICALQENKKNRAREGDGALIFNQKQNIVKGREC